MIIIATKNCNS